MGESIALLHTMPLLYVPFLADIHSFVYLKLSLVDCMVKAPGFKDFVYPAAGDASGEGIVTTEYKLHKALLSCNISYL